MNYFHCHWCHWSEKYESKKQETKGAALNLAHRTRMCCSKPELVEYAIDENVKLVAADIVRRSPIIADLAAKKKVTIVPAKYDLDEGKVRWF